MNATVTEMNLDTRKPWGIANVGWPKGRNVVVNKRHRGACIKRESTPTSRRMSPSMVFAVRPRPLMASQPWTGSSLAPPTLRSAPDHSGGSPCLSVLEHCRLMRCLPLQLLLYLAISLYVCPPLTCHRIDIYGWLYTAWYLEGSVPSFRRLSSSIHRTRLLVFVCIMAYAAPYLNLAI